MIQDKAQFAFNGHFPQQGLQRSIESFVGLPSGATENIQPV